MEVRAIDAAKLELSNIQDWDVETYNIDPPKSRLIPGDGDPFSLNLEDYLQPPNLNEHEELARNDQGGLRHLNDTQKQQIRNTGSFTVPSQRFEGQEHEWEIHNGLQKGKQPTLETFRDNFVFTANQFVIQVPNRLWRHETFSTWEGLKSIVLAILDLPVQIFGGMERRTQKPQNLQQMHIETLVQQLLDCTVEEFNDYSDDNVDVKTEDGFTIRFATARKEPIRAQLSEPYAEFKKLWDSDQPRRRRQLREELAGTYPDQEELKQEVVNAEAKEFQEGIYELIHAVLSEDDAKELCSLMNAIGYIRETLYHYNQMKRNATEIYVNQLAQQHSILSRIPEWVLLKRSKFENQWVDDHPFEGMLDGIAEKLSGQERYLFNKHREVADSVKRKVEEQTTKVPRRTFDWGFRIWMPKNWKITRHENNNGDVHYTCDKWRTYATTSKVPGWRLGNTFIRIGQYFWNGLFGVVSNMIYGPFGFRSWFGLDDYQPDKTVDHKTGELKPTGTKFATWFGRIRALWRNIRESREKFESTPEGGFFGKSFTRPFHLFWNYICKGLIGTAAAFVGHALLGVGNAALSLGLIATSPVWALGGSIAVYLFNELVYDFDSTTDRHWFPLPQIIVKDFLFLGVGRTIAAPIAAVCHVLLGSLGAVGSTLRFAGRSVWDYLMFHTIVRWKGRVPERDGFLARRTKGPGISMQYYQIVDGEFAVMMMQYKLEQMYIAIYEKMAKGGIDTPLRRLEEFQGEFKAVGLQPDSRSDIIKGFENTNRKLYEKLSKVLSEHRKKFILRGNIGSTRVRLTREDLQKVLALGEVLCKEFCEDFIYELLIDQDAVNEFWREQNIPVDDYEALATEVLRKAFSGSSILQPIEDTDPSGFRMHVQHIDTKVYLRNLFRDAQVLDDLQAVRYEEPPLPLADNVYPSSEVSVVTPCSSSNRVTESQFRLVQ